jgi:hypothetical protein
MPLLLGHACFGSRFQDRSALAATWAGHIMCRSADMNLFWLAREGMVGFGRDMGATRSLLEGDDAGQAINIAQEAQAECERYLVDPLRRYKIWRRVRVSL